MLCLFYLYKMYKHKMLSIGKYNTYFNHNKQHDGAQNSKTLKKECKQGR